MQITKDLTKLHKPVLVNEVLDAFALLNAKVEDKNSKFIDATLGFGGHTSEIVKREGSVLSIEADKETFEITSKYLSEAYPDLYKGDNSPSRVVYGNFKDIDLIAGKEGFNEVSGILYDLGVSSYQLTSSERGFSFEHPDSILDMRLDRETNAVTGADLLNTLREDQLQELFSLVMGDYLAKKLAHDICKKRLLKKFETVSDFIGVAQYYPGRSKNIKNVTLPFLALRIAVNSELQNLTESLPKAYDLLVKGGRMAVITFHSEEDRIVKFIFKELEEKKSAIILTKKPITPGTSELNENPRSRSAKLRVIEKK